MNSATINEARLEACLTALESARTWSPRTISKLETTIRIASDYDLFRINPFAFAFEKSLSESEALDLFLYGTQASLFVMEWHLICSACAHVVDSMQEIGKLHPHFYCDFCGLHNEAAMDDYIHVSFTLSTNIRDNAYCHPETLPIEDYYYRYHFAKGTLPYGGEKPLSQIARDITRVIAWVAADESHTYEIDPGPGMFHAKDLSNRTMVSLFLGDPKEKTWVVPLQLDQGKFTAENPQLDVIKLEFPVGTFEFPQAAQMDAGPLIIKFTNQMNTPCPLWIVHYPPDFQAHLVEFEPVLTGKRLLTTQTFRDLFRGASVPPDDTIGIKDATYLFTDIKGSTDLYDRVGDPNAFFLVIQHFEVLQQVIKEHQGALVKTIGDAIMAIFLDPVSGVKAGLAMIKAVEKIVGTLNEKVILKVGLNRGHSIVVTLDNRLDYFGQTVNIASRVQSVADAGEIVITEDVYEYPEVKGALEGLTISTEEVTLKGVGGPVKVYRIKP
jgi:class 3 adenylate cyclase